MRNVACQTQRTRNISLFAFLFVLLHIEDKKQKLKPIRTQFFALLFVVVVVVAVARFNVVVVTRELLEVECVFPPEPPHLSLNKCNTLF